MINTKGYWTPQDFDNHMLNELLPPNETAQPTILSLLKQARDKALNDRTSFAPDFFSRFIDLKASGAIGNPKLPDLTKWDFNI